MTHNPYEPPVYAESHFPAPPRNPRSSVYPPAITLLVFSAIWLLLIMVSTVLRIPEFMARIENDPLHVNVPYFIGTSLPFLVNIGVIWGSIQMLRFRSYTSARVAAILALLPACGPCLVLGIPLGIWALIVLSNEHVKQEFTS